MHQGQNYVRFNCVVDPDHQLEVASQENGTLIVEVSIKRQLSLCVLLSKEDREALIDWLLQHS